MQAFVDDKPILDAKIDAGADNGQAFVAARSATAEFRAIRAVALDHTAPLRFPPLPRPSLESPGRRRIVARCRPAPEQ